MYRGQRSIWFSWFRVWSPFLSAKQTKFLSGAGCCAVPCSSTFRHDFPQDAARDRGASVPSAFLWRGNYRQSMSSSCNVLCGFRGHKCGFLGLKCQFWGLKCRVLSRKHRQKSILPGKALQAVLQWHKIVSCWCLSPATRIEYLKSDMCSLVVLPQKALEWHGDNLFYPTHPQFTPIPPHGLSYGVSFGCQGRAALQGTNLMGEMLMCGLLRVPVVFLRSYASFFGKTPPPEGKICKKICVWVWFACSFFARERNNGQTIARWCLKRTIWAVKVASSEGVAVTRSVSWGFLGARPKDSETGHRTKGSLRKGYFQWKAL